MNLSFFKGRNILITGHTGFKGSWLCRILVNAGAFVTGYSLDPPPGENLYSKAGLEGCIRSVTGDVRDFVHLKKVFEEFRPEIVFHLAAQPIVRDSYKEPLTTFETNVMGTVNLLECVRQTPSVKSVLNVTTDKVYKNLERRRGYCEDDELDGFDPYSNSKSCSELVTHSYTRSFFSAEGTPAVSTARSGNVIGGGDFARDRIIPDCIRAVREQRIIDVRNPDSIRPYQHVLDSLSAYLAIAQRQYEDKNYAGSYNVGPEECDCLSTGELTDLFCSCWENGASWRCHPVPDAPHEGGCLLLDCSRIRTMIGWRPKWRIAHGMEMVCRFGRVWISGGDIPAEMDREIRLFFGE